ncbi:MULTISPECIES: MbtH family protein [Pseudomonadati]|uniref:MbtH family protein n=1 Tax=Pseudomonadati TaxID=3379134 RepID=UPI00202588A2|nr:MULTISPECIES: MbtH family NRPS accessory protein [Bacteria]CAH2559758.1 MbtH-like family protein [Cardinium endosymbiont of Oedothorax gibbosus]CAH2559889.1 MbtH-like family protein [Cardinium endosymbiont of Oedothorax gibbosus]
MSDKHETYICLINEEEQYSLWFAWKPIPHGWKQVRPKGSKEECLQYINQVWTDMKPKSLREKMDKLTASN